MLPLESGGGEVSRGTCFAVCSVCGIKHVFEQHLVLSGGSFVLVGETHGWRPQACYNNIPKYLSRTQTAYYKINCALEWEWCIGLSTNGTHSS